MPRYKIEKSLYEPVTVEVEDLPTLESVPLMDSVKQVISDLSLRAKNKEIGDGQLIEGEFAAIFGLDEKEVAAYPPEVRERAVILALSTFASRTKSALQPLETMTVAKALANVPPIPEASAEKNVLTPGSEPTL